MQIMSRNVDVRGSNVAAVRALFSQNDANTVICRPKLGPKPPQPAPRGSPQAKKSPTTESRRPQSTAELQQTSFTSIEQLKSKFQNSTNAVPLQRVTTPIANEQASVFHDKESSEEPKPSSPEPPIVETNAREKNDSVDVKETSHSEASNALPRPTDLPKPLQANNSQLANILDNQSRKSSSAGRWYANITTIENLSQLKLPISPPTPTTSLSNLVEEPVIMFGGVTWRRKPLPPLSVIGLLPPPKPQRPSFVTAVARGAWVDTSTPQLPERKPFMGTNNSCLHNERKLESNGKQIRLPPSTFGEKDNYISPTTSSTEDLYDDTSQVPPPPPPREKINTIPAETEELYDDTSVKVQEGELYEDISTEGENIHYMNGDFIRKSKSLFKLRRDSRDKDRKQKDFDKLKKKFNLTGQEALVETGVIKETLKNRKGDFSVRKGERIRILRMENNPPGKWLVINENGEMGYVELTNIEVDANSVKSVMFKSSTSPMISSILENNVAYAANAEAIYEEFH